MKKNINIINALLCIGTLSIQAARSIHRPQNMIPHIEAQWQSDQKSYVLADSHIEEYPLFYAYDYTKNLLPRGIIDVETKTQAPTGEHLGFLIEDLLKEISLGKRKFSHFILLQTKNFSWRRKIGLIVLKFKDYPLVLKLFLETPKTFCNPYCKGIEPICFFFMAGGTNRHVLGLTRIPNLEQIRKKITTMPEWADRVEFPRKWLWLPKDPQWIELTGKNIGSSKELHNKIPGIYAIIADAIDTKNEYTLLSAAQKKKEAMKLCNDLDCYLDPHAKNYIFKPSQTSKDGYKIVVIDTEHFPTMSGIKEKQHFENHYSWYMYLISKCFNDTFLRTKKDRIRAQNAINNFALKTD